MSRMINFWIATFCCLVAGAITGCGGSGGGGSATGTTTLVLANSTGSARSAANLLSVRGGSGGGPVDISEIESLTVTVTEIVLQRCGSGEDDSEEGADETETVLVEDFSFDPTAVTIEEGGTVRWVWTTDTPHTVTSGQAGDLDAGSLFDEDASTAGTVVELVFADVGAFPYFSNTEDDIAEGMAGTVNVVAEDDEGGDDEGDDEGEDDEGEDSEEETGGHVTVYEGAFDVNLLDLAQLSEVLTSAEVPAGDYCKIRIRIENPRLVLVSDPLTVITDVHLTANGRLFIKDHFEVEADEEIVIVIDFGGIHLVLAGGSGKYVLTPQLSAEIDVTEVEETEIEGEIISIDSETRILDIQTEGGAVFEVVVNDDTEIETDDDSDDVSEIRGEDEAQVALAFEDLAVGQNVEVEGTLVEGSQILAREVEIADEDFETAPTL